MSSTKIESNTIETKNALVVVSAKEHGKLYRIADGELSIYEYVEEHPPQYSDNEGFFFRSSGGKELGSGAPREEDDAQNIKRYMKAIESELRAALVAVQPERVYLFEPEHLKGLVVAHLVNPHHIPIETVAYGNFVQHSPSEIVAMLEKHLESASDPSDPQSVAGEPNAEEKRKILETGRLRDEQE